MEEFKNSFVDGLGRRFTSPFYGTFIISWSVVNWKIIYLTIFVSQDKIIGTKLTYIEDNLMDAYRLWWLPMLSTVLILTLFQIVLYGSYYFDQWLKKIRRDVYYKFQNKQMLSIEESLELKKRMRAKSEELSKDMDEKDGKIKSLDILLTEERVRFQKALGDSSDLLLVKEEEAKRNMELIAHEEKKYLELKELEQGALNRFHELREKSNSFRSAISYWREILDADPTIHLVLNNLYYYRDGSLLNFDDDNDKRITDALLEGGKLVMDGNICRTTDEGKILIRALEIQENIE